MQRGTSKRNQEQELMWNLQNSLQKTIDRSEFLQTIICKIHPKVSLLTSKQVHFINTVGVVCELLNAKMN